MSSAFIRPTMEELLKHLPQNYRKVKEIVPRDDSPVIYSSSDEEQERTQPTKKMMNTTC